MNIRLVPLTLGPWLPKSDGLMGTVESGEDNLRGKFGDKFKVHWEIGGKKKHKNYQNLLFSKPLDRSKGTIPLALLFNREDEYTDYNEDGEMK